MIKSRSYYIITLLLGIALVGACLLCRLDYWRRFLSYQQLKSLSGVFLGIGGGLVGMSFSNLIMVNIQRKNPKIKHQNEIEYKDERNISIRNQAKAKSADIIQWFIMGIAYLSILISSPVWITLIIVGVFSLYHILYSYYMVKYKKEM